MDQMDWLFQSKTVFFLPSKIISDFILAILRVDKWMLSRPTFILGLYWQNPDATRKKINQRCYTVSLERQSSSKKMLLENRYSKPMENIEMLSNIFLQLHIQTPPSRLIKQKIASCPDGNAVWGFSPAGYRVYLVLFDIVCYNCGQLGLNSSTIWGLAVEPLRLLVLMLT
ncbi:unnamed protein product [Protopolystoma xenopodis]|uniref:Uncharacterized protein n=1 Tax=Protopolystoma xenopodis TaxID=117903 RepID=A0A448WG72_9PLAT|nr:unnamed protein product [Protopolystoma xenopodis]